MDFFKKMDVPEDQEKDTVPMDDMKTEKVKCLIVGSGPAGYTAAIYAARANLKPLMLQGLEPGGQLTTTTDVENYPGYPEGIKGPEMMEEFKAQAERFGTEVRMEEATRADLSKQPYSVVVEEEYKIEADTVIIATGASAKYLGLESEERFKGNGVSACATCDGFFYRGMDVAVVGGGDTAAEEATYLAGLAKKVYMIVRKPYLRASKAMQERIFNTPNIEVLYEHNTKELYGNNTLEGVKLIKRKGEKDEEEVDLKVQGFFLAIGHHPNSDIFQDYLETDQIGYIKTDGNNTKTNVEGVFACGDVQDNIYRQAVTAAGSGCMAALDAERYLGTRKF